MPPQDFAPTPERHALQTRFLTALRAGAALPAAAAQAGAPLRTFYTWRRRNASFRQAWRKARAQARATRYDVPAPPSVSAGAKSGSAQAADPPKRLHVVLTSFSPERPDHHLLMEIWPDGTRTDTRWEEYPSRETLLKRGEDPEEWEAGRAVWEARQAEEAAAAQRDSRRPDATGTPEM